MVSSASEALGNMETLITRIRDEQAELLDFEVIIATLKCGIREDQAVIGELEAKIEALKTRIRENQARLEEGNGGLNHGDIPEVRVTLRKLSPQEYVQRFGLSGPIGQAICELIMKIPDGIIEIYERDDGKVVFKV